MRGHVVIAGIGQTAFGKLPGRSTVSLNIEACGLALADAGIAKDAVDALLVKPPTSNPQFMGTITGPVLGAFLIVPLEGYFRAALGGAGPGVHLILLGLVMVLAALFMRRGITGALDAAWQRWRHARSK